MSSGPVKSSPLWLWGVVLLWSMGGCLDTHRAQTADLDALADGAASADVADDASGPGDAAAEETTGGSDATTDTPGTGADVPPPESCDQPGATRCSDDHTSLEFCGGAELVWSTEFAAPCGDDRCFDTCDVGAEDCEIACLPAYNCSQTLECVAGCITIHGGDFAAQSACENACKDQASTEQKQVYDVLDVCSNANGCRTSELGQINCLFTHCPEQVVECTVTVEGTEDCSHIAFCSQGCTSECASQCQTECAADPEAAECTQCVSLCGSICSGECFADGTKDAQIQALQAFLCGQGLDCSDAPNASYCNIEHCGEGLVECSYGDGGTATCVDTGQCLAQCAIDCAAGSATCYADCQNACLAAATTESAVLALLMSSCLTAACPEATASRVLCLNAAMGPLGECRDDFVDCCSTSGETNLAQCKFF